MNSNLLACCRVKCVRSAITVTIPSRIAYRSRINMVEFHLVGQFCIRLNFGMPSCSNTFSKAYDVLYECLEVHTTLDARFMRVENICISSAFLLHYCSTWITNYSI